MVTLVEKTDSTHFCPDELMKDSWDFEACDDCCARHKWNCMECPIQKAFDRLARYEQTGLEPEEIEELKAKYEDDRK